MSGTEIRKNLVLTPAPESSCACCATPAATALEATTRPADATGAVYGLEGLTCGGCVQSVERAVRAVDGVDSATVTLVPGGASSLSVSGSATPELVGAAVVAAGYTFTQVN